MHRNTINNVPTILVVLGATGDLMARKIAPSLFHLYAKQQLPDLFRVVGFARRELTDGEFQEHIVDAIKKHKEIDQKTTAEFSSAFSYAHGVFDALEDYKRLAVAIKQIDDQWGICSNKLFYLAVPPEYYEMIFKNLAASGLTDPCSPEEGWTRVIVEKPFGKNYHTAKKLDELLDELFKEVQIYRIDHYLAKEMIQNILTFRFSNNLFESDWSNRLIERIHIKLWETLGVEDRGSFYDGVGALRDVGQNHLLQMLAFVTMEQPSDLSAEAIRRERARILQALVTPQGIAASGVSYRSQYKGYQSIRGVAPDSKTETYFKIQASLDTPRWRGVPIILESGKRMGEERKEIVVTFKHPVPCFCPQGIREHHKNKLIIHWKPTEGIMIKFWSKKPGLQMDAEERTFNFDFRDISGKTQYTEEYEKLLLDCIAGDQTLFLSSDEVEAMWRFVDRFLDEWEKDMPPLHIYVPDTLESIVESKHLEDVTSRKSLDKKELGMVGLGKMGKNLRARLEERGWRVAGYDLGQRDVGSLEELVKQLSPPRLVWLMVPAGDAVEETLFGSKGLTKFLEKGDSIIDGGNSFYEDSMRRAEKLEKLGIHFLDIGVSGGPRGARSGAALMVGGERDIFDKYEALFEDLALYGGYGYMGKAGAGHFVKMVHNGIEYGMMQALAEGFAILEKSPFQLDLEKVAGIYNHGSVIESRLVGWMNGALQEYGKTMDGVSGEVGYTGEGEWTVKTAKKLGVPAPVIEEAFQFRVQSHKTPSYIGKLLSALRNQFGGHSIQ